MTKQPPSPRSPETLPGRQTGAQPESPALSASSAPNLSQKAIGFSGEIAGLEGPAVLVSRLRELGFIRGEQITIRSVAPFGEPLIVELKGTTVALRKTEAQCILI